MPEFTEAVADPADYLPRNVPGVGPVVGEGGEALEAIIDYIAARGYTYEPWQIAAFVTAVQTKPFVILAGISGTGKTRLPQLVAEATEAWPVVVPVRPDWTDSSDLLGYQTLEGTFVPGRLLLVCEEAIRNPERQFFFILDEMNVARVEYYFAEVLSLMENRWREEAGAVVSPPLLPSAPAGPPPGDPDTLVQWSDVYLPGNVCIVGTVNMDETTHGFSRKVLDRSFVLELSNVDLSDIGQATGQRPPTVPWPADAWSQTTLRLAEREGAAEDGAVAEVVQTLARANEALSEAQLQVGYRTRDEVALFCLNAQKYTDSFVDSQQTVISPLDLCLTMKILPRIQGGGSLIRKVLTQLSSWTDPSLVGEQTTAQPAGFPRSSERITLMRERLEQTGFTSYWV